MRKVLDRMGNGVVILALLVVSACGSNPGSASTSAPADSITTTTTTTTATTLMPPTTQIATTSTSKQPVPVGDLLVIGDWGTGTMPQGAVAGAMSRYAEEAPVAALLTTGDNFYSDDADFLMEPFGWVQEKGIPFWVTWGNHDIETDERIQEVNRVFASPPPWTLQEWGDVDVLILDTNQVSSSEQLEFLKESLAGSDDPTIVVFHHPAFSCGRYQDNTEVLENWLPLFDDDVFLVLSGHDHNYQRFELDDVTFVVSGGGGRRLYDLSDCSERTPPLAAGKSIHHFLALHQDRDVVVSVLDVNGDVIDAFSLALPS